MQFLAIGIIAAMFAGCGAGSSPPSPPPSKLEKSASQPSSTPSELTPGEAATSTLTVVPVPTSLPALDDPQQIAAELIGAEAAIRSESTPPEAFSRLGRVQQAAYRKLVADPSYRAVAIAKAPPALKQVVQANIQAGAELRSLTKPAEKIPDWKIVQPTPAEELRRYYQQAQDRFGIPWAYLASIHLVETRMGRIRGTSSAGAQGPMQFIPGTWAQYGEGDINDPHDAIFAAARYLKASGAPAAMDKALFAYNRSQRYVSAINIYTKQMLDDERTYLAFYHWQVYVRTTSGDVLLEVGYGQ
ncbi:MAG: transglycosylase SLT domain-containing protein [Actinomycetota bacterium]